MESLQPRSAIRNLLSVQARTIGEGGIKRRPPNGVSAYFPWGQVFRLANEARQHQSDQIRLPVAPSFVQDAFDVGARGFIGNCHFFRNRL
jgi:hypothetical protein